MSGEASKLKKTAKQALSGHFFVFSSKKKYTKVPFSKKSVKIDVFDFLGLARTDKISEKRFFRFRSKKILKN